MAETSPEARFVLVLYSFNASRFGARWTGFTLDWYARLYESVETMSAVWNTLVVSTSDHEAGGLTLGRNINGRGVYDWKPEILERVETSQMIMAAKLVEWARECEGRAHG